MSRLSLSSIRPIPLVLYESASQNFTSFHALIVIYDISRTLRREPALTQFETAQIANLCPADAEEAKSIVPRYVFLARQAYQLILTDACVVSLKLTMISFKHFLTRYRP